MKTKEIVYDIEANNLLEKSTSIHCIVAKVIGEEGFYKFWDNSCVLHRSADKRLTKEGLLDLFTTASKIICHNQINYDIPMLYKFFGIDMYSLPNNPEIIDTFVWSQVLNPDRELPKGCPTTITPPPELRSQGFKSKKIGPHGLESWGYRVGERKLQIHDWRTFTPSMLSRCESDVSINEKTYKLLLQEGNL